MEPCIFVSNLGTGQVQVYDDSGNNLTQSFLSGYPSGGGGGEGMVCSLSANNNTLYMANNSASIQAFDLDTGIWKGTSFTASVGFPSIAGMTINAAGNLIYAADYQNADYPPGPGYIYSLVPSGPFSLSPPAATTTVYPDVHDIALGTQPPALAGEPFSTYFPPNDVGMDQWTNMGPYSSLSGQVQALPYPASGPYANGCAVFTNGTHCWLQVSGMQFDAAGNLWINSATYLDNGTFEFVQNGSTPPEFVPVNFTPSANPSGDLPVGLTIAPLTDPLYPGQILIADFLAGTISKIDPATCTGTVGGPGSCTRTTFFTPGGNPKYVQYNVSCPNTANDGYVEVCKQSNPSFPVTGTFDFTITAPQFSSGPVSVPVGECSEAIQVPSGTVTITEAQQTGVSVSDVNAYSYSPGYTNELVAWPAPNPTNPYAAEVNVQPGNDVALETIATFTNASQGGKTGQLKICKTAGPGIEVGEAFSFSTSGGGTKNKYSIEAGPAPGGYCELAGTYPIGTQVTVKETVPKGVYASIQVQPPGNGSHITASSVIATIGEGITEVNFTDSTQKPGTATLTPAKANFGKLKRGTQGKPITFTLTNTGGTTINIFSVALGGANPGDFFLLSNGCGPTLAPAANCTIQVVFSPLGTGTFTAQLIVTDDASNSPQISNLTGTGV